MSKIRPDEERMISDIKEEIRKILAVKIQPVVGLTPEDNEVLEIMQEKHARVLPLFKDVNRCPLHLLPLTFLRDDILSRLRQYYDHLLMLSTVPDWQQDHLVKSKLNNLLSTFVQWYEANFSSFANAVTQTERLSLLRPATEKLNGLLGETEKMYAQLEQREGVFSEEYVKIREDIEKWRLQQHSLLDEDRVRYSELLGKVETVIGDIGSKHHAIKFREEAKLQAKASYCWLVASALLSIAIIIYAVSIETTVLALVKDGVDKVWPLFAVRGVVISIGSILLFLCVRSFSACRHNVIVNRHRENALSTFRLFSEGAHDAETRTVILLEATRSVFAAAPSGYLKAANESNASTHLVEMVRTHASGGKANDE